MKEFVPIFQQQFFNREKLLKRIHLRRSKLSIAAELSEIFSEFSILCLVELQLDDPDLNPTLLFVYVVFTSLLICHTVILHISVCWLTPQLQTTTHLSHYDMSEFDTIPYEELIFVWDSVFVMATSGGFFIFTISFMLLLWIKFLQYGAVVCGTMLMAPVFLCVICHAAWSYKTEAGLPPPLRSKGKRSLQM